MRLYYAARVPISKVVVSVTYGLQHSGNVHSAVVSRHFLFKLLSLVREVQFPFPYLHRCASDKEMKGIPHMEIDHDTWVRHDKFGKNNVGNLTCSVQFPSSASHPLASHTHSRQQ